MQNRYYFSGLDFVTGKYKISNEDIKKYIELKHFEGFDPKRIKNLLEFKNQNKLDEFDFLCEKLMGFKYRYHVVPFPPNKFNYDESDNTIDLCVKATNNALKKAGLSGDDIDAWFASTATNTQYAPGLAEFLKSYFTEIHNNKPTYSLTSACVGFNINLEFAVNFLNTNPEAKHVLVAHSEIMSELLCEERDFVPFVTFGDAAAAVIISRVDSINQDGIISVVNYEDLKMIDFLGADSKGNLIMNPRMVKNIAVPNITKVFKELLYTTGWTINDVDFFIPHQTGNAIVDSVIKNLQLPENKVFKEIQLNYGNLSGASVPAALSLLSDNGKLKPGMKILTAVAGLGGEYGGFAYQIPEKFHFIPKSNTELKDKTILITGASGALGREIALNAASKSCAKIFLIYNSNEETINKIKLQIDSESKSQCFIIKADLSDENKIKDLKEKISSITKELDYLICTHAITGPLGKASEIPFDEYEKVLKINYFSIKNIVESFENIIKESLIIIGSVGEDAQFPGSAPYVSSKRALRAFAREAASKLYEKKIRTIYYLPGIIDSGMVDKLSTEQITSSLTTIRQNKMTPVKEIAERILLAANRINIPGIRRTMESKLLVIKDSYLNF